MIEAGMGISKYLIQINVATVIFLSIVLIWKNNKDLEY